MTITKPATCKSCGAKIIFMRTKTGKFIPVNLDTNTNLFQNELFNSKKHTSHFATCPNASKHRKPGINPKC